MLPLYRNQSNDFYMMGKLVVKVLMSRITINPFHATSLFLHPLKISENERFSSGGLMFSGSRERDLIFCFEKSSIKITQKLDIVDLLFFSPCIWKKIRVKLR